MTSVRQDLGRQLLTAVRWQRDDAEAARLVAAGAGVRQRRRRGRAAAVATASRMASRACCAIVPTRTRRTRAAARRYFRGVGRSRRCASCSADGFFTPTYGGLIGHGRPVGSLTAHEWAKERGQRPVSALLGDKARVAALHAPLLDTGRRRGRRRPQPSAPAPTSSPIARRVSPPKQWTAAEAEEDARGRGEDSSPIASPGRLQPVGRRPVARSLGHARGPSPRPPGPALMQARAIWSMACVLGHSSTCEHRLPEPRASRARARAPPPCIHAPTPLSAAGSDCRWRDGLLVSFSRK